MQTIRGKNFKNDADKLLTLCLAAKIRKPLLFTKRRDSLTWLEDVCTLTVRVIHFSIGEEFLFP